jgi:serine/threonine protein phosphatase PrpC
MHKKLIGLALCWGVALCYASEKLELVMEQVEQKKVGIYSIDNKRGHVFQDRFYHSTFEGGHLYAIYDGHGSEHVAHFLAEKFPIYLSQTSSLGSIKERMMEAFKNADNDNFVKEHNAAGSTASVVFIKDNVAHFAHVGDSRMLLAADGKVSFVTSDHKPNRPDEYNRIIAANGVVMNNRVCGFLAVSRAFGNYNLLGESKKMIIVEPEYAKISLTEKNRFLVLATDGLWDVVSDEEVVQQLHDKKEDCHNMSALAKLLAMFADCRKSKDDITVMVVDLLS